jgi:hypothetical protein
MAKARTFYDDQSEIDVEVVWKFGTGDMYLVVYGEKKLVRHRDRLVPLDEEARQVLGK